MTLLWWLCILPILASLAYPIWGLWRNSRESTVRLFCDKNTPMSKPKFSPQLEKFSRALAENLAGGMTKKDAAIEAAKHAGYRGNHRSFDKNAEKRARTPEVKRRVAELMGPIDKTKKASMSPEEVATINRIEASRGWVKQRLTQIASLPFDPQEITVRDQIRAMGLLIEIEKWEAQTQQPVHTELTGMTLDQLKAEIIERARGLGLFDEPFRLVDGEKV